MKNTRGSALVQVIVVAAALLLAGLALYKFLQLNVNQKAAVRAKQSTARIRNYIKIMANGYCADSTFRKAGPGGGSNLTYSGGTVDLVAMYFGTITKIIAVGENIDGFTASKMQFVEVSAVSPSRRIVDFVVEGKTSGQGLLGRLDNATITQRLEVNVDPAAGNKLLSCSDRNTYFETAVIERNAFALDKVGCNATAVPAAGLVPMPDAAKQGYIRNLPVSWIGGPTLYRKMAPGSNPYPIPSPPLTNNWELAIMSVHTCAPVSSSHTCPHSCPSGAGASPATYYDSDASCDYVTGPGTYDGITGISPSYVPIIPPESYRSPTFITYGADPLRNSVTKAWGCTVGTNPTTGLPYGATDTAQRCENFSPNGGGPEDFVQPVNLDHPEYNINYASNQAWNSVSSPSTLWKQFFPVRKGTSKRIDETATGTAPKMPTELAAREGRCWAEVIAKPDSGLNADNIFIIPQNEHDLSVGCRAAKPASMASALFTPWQLMGCAQGHQSTKNKFAGDHDVNIAKILDPTGTIVAGTVCSTNDHTQPHLGGIWTTTRVSLTAFCGHVVNSGTGSAP